jgi:serine/threonine protein kinase/Flp pilus assembly protein TadD
MKCPKCQTENREDSRFCNQCATSLVAAADKSPKTEIDKPPEAEAHKPSKDVVDESPYVAVEQPADDAKAGSRDTSQVVFSEATRTIELATRSLEKGTIIADKYRIGEKLGEGGMGIVYKALDMTLNRDVALKFLPPEYTRDKDARERFVREAKAASALDHPNICTIHEINKTEDEQVFIVMAYYEGQNLKGKIKRGPLKQKDVIDLALQVAQGISAAHKKGIIHRDIKPTNIMITNERAAKILDFGIAKLSGQEGLTRPLATVGTVSYMSPEQARGETIDVRSDIWSLGIVMYEMITGRLPFKGDNTQAILYNVMNEEPRSVKDLRSEIPSELEHIIQKALAKDPKKRFSSGRELATELEDLKTRMTLGTVPVFRPKHFFRSRKRVMIAGAVCMLLIVVIFATWILTRPSLAFEERDKLLVADVDNQTEEAVFDLALRTAIEADLQQSPFARVFDKSEVAETLRLMRKDPSSRIDEELGMSVCRFAGVRALILPRILSAGEAYELQAILIDPVKMRHVDRIRVTALGQEEVLLHAIDELVREVRSSLGESIGSIEEADVPVVKVATSSWEALQYLAMGQEKRQAGQFREAERLYNLAIERDPHFASAKGSLGLILIQFLNQKEKGQEMLRQALQDAEGLPQQEYLMIKAVNKWYVDEDFNGALEEYRLVRELYPDLWTAYNNPGVILRGLGQFDEAIAMFEKAAELAPRTSIPLANLWFTHLNYKKDPRAAEEIARRLIELAPEIAYCHHFFGYSLAAQARYEEALDAYRKTIEIEPNHPYGRPNLAHLLLVTGKAVDAIPHYREVRVLVSQGKIHGTYVSSSLDLAIASKFAGDEETAKSVAAEGRDAHLKTMEEMGPNVQLFLVLALLDFVAGELQEAEEYIKKANEMGINDPYSMMNLAEYHALSGNKELAIEALKSAFELGYSDPYFPMIIPAFQPIRFEPEFKAVFDVKSETPKRNQE